MCCGDRYLAGRTDPGCPLLTAANNVDIGIEDEEPAIKTR